MSRRTVTVRVALVLYLAAVACLTLGPSAPRSSDGWISATLRWLSHVSATNWITYSLIEFAANIALFLPIGALAFLVLSWTASGLRRPPTHRAALSVGFGLVLTIAIETVQLIIPGRVSDLRDIAANSIGTLIGVVLVSTVIRWRPSPVQGEAGAAPRRQTPG